MADKYKKTLIQVLQYDNKFTEMAAKLLPLVKRSKFDFVNTGSFTKKSWQYYENVEMRVPVPLINEANNLYDEINKLCEYVYKESDTYDYGRLDIRPLIYEDNEETVEHDVVFDEIENKVIQGIRDAKYLIWIACPWVSNKNILRELWEKQKAGLSVRIIISDEDSNNPEIQKHFDTVIVNKFGSYGTNRLHYKFCIIDLDYIMHGSYNLTASANYNKEELATAIDKSFVMKYADEFMDAYRQGKNIK